MKREKPIFLIGYMGCGKTTLGRALQKRLGLRFFDLDTYVEERLGCSVAECFARYGEARFREEESRSVSRLCADALREGNYLIACGGGTPCRPGMMELLNSCGLTVHLTTSVERLVERLCVARSHRPLIAGLSDGELSAFVRGQLALRMPFYSRAAAEFDSTFLEDEAQIEATVDNFIKRFIE